MIDDPPFNFILFCPFLTAFGNFLHTEHVSLKFARARAIALARAIAKDAITSVTRISILQNMNSLKS